MAKLVNSKFDKRVIFPSGKQNHFLLTAKQDLKLSWSQFTERIGVHKRTLNDWRREKYSLPFNILQKVSEVTRTKIPKNIQLKDRYWYVTKGAKLGGMVVLKKYGRIGGNPEYRKKKWYEWWEREGRYKQHPIINAPLPIKKPRKSKALAEFVGIMIGDGGISKGQVTVSLNSETDNPYSVFVKNLIKKLFKVEPSSYLRKDKSAVNIVVSRKRLVDFCQSIGLRVGNKLKQNLDIPKWVRESRSFRIFCLRGLVDTDGCIFNECHRINNKKYCYPRLAFTSYSKQLRSSVFKILKELNFSPKIRSKRNIQLENRDDIIKYFNLIGTSNLKHKRKFEIAFGGVGSGCPRWF